MDLKAIISRSRLAGGHYWIPNYGVTIAAELISFTQWIYIKSMGNPWHKQQHTHTDDICYMVCHEKHAEGGGGGTQQKKECQRENSAYKILRLIGLVFYHFSRSRSILIQLEFA